MEIMKKTGRNKRVSSFFFFFFCRRNRQICVCVPATALRTILLQGPKLINLSVYLSKSWTFDISLFNLLPLSTQGVRVFFSFALFLSLDDIPVVQMIKPVTEPQNWDEEKKRIALEADRRTDKQTNRQTVEQDRLDMETYSRQLLLSVRQTTTKRISEGL